MKICKIVSINIIFEKNLKTKILFTIWLIFLKKLQFNLI
jgi:hypothetical protein